MSIDLLNKIAQLLTENSIAIGSVTVTLSGTASPLTNIPTDAKSALIQIESSNTTDIVMRFWENGFLPTSTDGMFRMHGDFVEILTSQNLQSFRAISITGTTKIQVTYYK